MTNIQLAAGMRFHRCPVRRGGPRLPIAACARKAKAAPPGSPCCKCREWQHNPVSLRPADASGEPDVVREGEEDGYAD